MIFAVFFFFLIVVLPYYLYFKKRYKESNDKQTFLKENLYHSTIWIIVLVALPWIAVNFLVEERPQASTLSYQTMGIHDFEEYKTSHLHDQNFLKAYIDKFAAFTVMTDSAQAAMEAYLWEVQDDRDLAAWSLAYYSFKKNRHRLAFGYLDSIPDDRLGGQYLLYAQILKSQKKDSLITPYLIREIQHELGNRIEAYAMLSEVLVNHQDLDLLKTALTLPDYTVYLNYQDVRQMLFEHGEFGFYYRCIMDWFVGDVDAIDVLAAFLIFMVWMIYLLRLNFFDSVKLHWVVILFLAAMVFCFFTFLISDLLRFQFGFWESYNGFWSLLAYCVFGIGAVEEIVKAIPVLLLVMVYGKRLGSYELIVYACASALGFAFVENIMYFDENFGSIIHGRALTSAVGHMLFSSILVYGFVVSFYKKTIAPIPAFFLFWFLASLAHGLYDFWLFADLYLFFIFFFFAMVRIWVTVINNSLNNSPGFRYNPSDQTKPIQFYLTFALTAILMFEFVLVALTEGVSSANSSLMGAGFSGSFIIMFLGSKLTSLNLIKGHWFRMELSGNPFTDDVVSQNFIGQTIYLYSYYTDRGLIEYADNGIRGTIIERRVLYNQEPTWYRSFADSEWFVVKLHTPLVTEQYNRQFVLIKFKEAHSSLNAKKSFLVNLLLVPPTISRGRMYRKYFESLGWTFLQTQPLDEQVY